MTKEDVKKTTADGKPVEEALSFEQFVRIVKPKFQWYRHNLVVAEVLQKVADGELCRVMFFWPPRHGKSEEISRLFSAYYLYRHPDRFVGINSYSAALAYTLSRAARENFKAAGGTTKGDADAVQHWETPYGGGLWAAGVGGPITGKGFHLGIIDDPLKNAEEAGSETIREKQKEWYASTFYTREEPGGAIILVQTRWNEDDLGGWLLSDEGSDDESECWHIVNLAAILEAVEIDAEGNEVAAFPSTCTVEPDWRKIGEPLCPERYPLSKLLRICKRVGEYVWGALYQQRPRAKNGEFFNVEKLQIDLAPPAILLRSARVRAYDLAATEGAGDFTAGVLMAGPDADGQFYILEVIRDQWGTDKRDATMRRTAVVDGTSTRIRIPQDPAAAGKAQVGTLVKLLVGYNVIAETVGGDKATRAGGFSSQVNAGNVHLIKGPWNKAFIEELRGFPRGKHDDQVDAASDAFNELTLGPRSGSPVAGGEKRNEAASFAAHQQAAHMPTGRAGAAWRPQG